MNWSWNLKQKEFRKRNRSDVRSSNGLSSGEQTFLAIPLRPRNLGSAISTSFRIVGSIRCSRIVVKHMILSGVDINMEMSGLSNMVLVFYMYISESNHVGQTQLPPMNLIP